MLRAIVAKYDPASMLNSAAQQEVMQDLLLAKIGYMDFFTLMEKMGIQNVTPPDMHVPTNVVERLALQAKLGIGMISNAQGRKATNQAPPSMGQSGNGPIIQTS
jgi:hypothetical protein